MPATLFYIIWPDGSEERCYSPSTVIHQYLTEDSQYELEEFTRLCDQALHEASERVRAKFGFACSSAMDQLQVIREKSATFAHTPGARITVTRITGE